MGTKIELTASDGHRLDAYCAAPEGKAKGGVVVIQEIFGVNHHIRAVCDRFAQLGYKAVAPALFDRQTKDFECGYGPEDMKKAFRWLRDPGMGEYLIDTRAAVDYLKAEGPVSVVGFCLGGTVAFGAATAIDGLSSAVAYYGGHLKWFSDLKPRCPVMMHFGAQDNHIPMTVIDKIRQQRPDCDIHVYEDTGHGFNCDERASYNKAAADLAWQRSIDWIAKGQARN